MTTLAGRALLERARLTLDVPLARTLGLRLVADADPAAGVVLEVVPPGATGYGGAHSGAMTAALEAAAYLALAPHLDETEHAVTQSLALSLPAPAPEGVRVVAVGEVDRRTGRTAYLTAVAHVDGIGPVVARAQLVKAVVPLG